MKIQILLAAVFLSVATFGQAAAPIEKIGQVNLGSRQSGEVTLTISDDGQRLLKRGLGDKTDCTVYDVITGKPVFQKASVRSTELSPDGRWITFVESDREGNATVHLCSVDNGKEMYSFKQKDGVLNVVFDPSGRLMFHTCWKNDPHEYFRPAVQAVSLADGTQPWAVVTPADHGDCRVVCSYDGSRALLLTTTALPMVIDTANGKTVSMLAVGPKAAVNAAYLSSDGKQALVIDGLIPPAVFDTATGKGKPIGSKPLSYYNATDDLAWVRDPSKGIARLLNVATGEIRQLRISSRPKSLQFFSRSGNVVVSLEDANRGLAIVSRVPPAEQWLIERRPAVSVAGVNTMLPSALPPVTPPAAASVPATEKPDAWLTLAEAELKKVTDTEQAARILWRIAAVRAAIGQVDEASALITQADAKKVNLSPGDDWLLNDKLQAYYEVASRLAAKDLSTADKFLSNLSEDDRFAADTMPAQAKAIGRIAAKDYSGAAQLVQACRGEARDIVADRCIRALSIAGAYDQTRQFLDLMAADANGRIRAMTGLLHQAALAGEVNVAYRLLKELKVSPQSNTDFLRPFATDVACAAEKAKRADVIAGMAVASTGWTNAVTEGRAKAMAEAGRWDDLLALLQSAEKQAAKSAVNLTAPIAAAKVSEDVLIKIATTGGQTDWGCVADAYMSAGKIAESTALLNKAEISDAQKQDIRVRIASNYLKRGEFDKAVQLSPELRSEDAPRLDLLERAKKAWTTKDKAGFNAICRTFDASQTVTNPLGADVARRAMFRLEAGDLQGAWALIRENRTFVISQVLPDFYRRAADDDAIATAVLRRMEANCIADRQSTLLRQLYEKPTPVVAAAYRRLALPGNRAELLVAHARRITPPDFVQADWTLWSMPISP